MIVPQLQLGFNGDDNIPKRKHSSLQKCTDIISCTSQPILQQSKQLIHPTEKPSEHEKICLQ